MILYSPFNLSPAGLSTRCPAVRGGGVRCLGVELASLSFARWPLDGRPGCARSLVPTPSNTVDQTLPPDGMGKAFTV